MGKRLRSWMLVVFIVLLVSSAGSAGFPSPAGPDTALAATSLITVDSIADTSDVDLTDGPCGGGPGAWTLRAAMQQSSASAGVDGIIFNIGGGGTQTISPASELPEITDPVLIDGSTQPGFRGTPLIVLNGRHLGP